MIRNLERLTAGMPIVWGGDKVTLVEAGDCVHQRPGLTHYLFDYSPDMEYLEVVGPADFSTNDVEGPCAVPAPKAWGKTRPGTCRQGLSRTVSNAAAAGSLSSRPRSSNLWTRV